MDFDGWLINIESDADAEPGWMPEAVDVKVRGDGVAQGWEPGTDYMHAFTYWLRYECRQLAAQTNKADPLVIWYDAMSLSTGKVKWECYLSKEHNAAMLLPVSSSFFDASASTSASDADGSSQTDDRQWIQKQSSDAIFMDYHWQKEWPANSVDLLRELQAQSTALHASDSAKQLAAFAPAHSLCSSNSLLFGIDVWGRGTWGGGEFQSGVAVDLCRRAGTGVAIFGQAWAWEKAQSDATIVAKQVMKLLRAGTSRGITPEALAGIDVRGIAAWFSSLHPEGKQRVVESLLWDGGVFPRQLKPNVLLHVLDAIGGTSDAGIQFHCKRAAYSSRRIGEVVRKIIQSEGSAAGNHAILCHSPWHWLAAGGRSSADLGTEDEAAVASKLERLAEAVSNSSASRQTGDTLCRDDYLYTAIRSCTHVLKGCPDGMVLQLAGLCITGQSSIDCAGQPHLSVGIKYRSSSVLHGGDGWKMMAISNERAPSEWAGRLPCFCLRSSHAWSDLQWTLGISSRDHQAKEAVDCGEEAGYLPLTSLRRSGSSSAQVVDGHGVVLHESTAKGVAEESRDGSPFWTKVTVSAPLPKSLLSGASNNFTLQARVQAKDAEHWAGHFGCDVALPSIAFIGCCVDKIGFQAYGLAGHAADQSDATSTASTHVPIDGGPESEYIHPSSGLGNTTGHMCHAVGPTIGNALGSLAVSSESGSHLEPACAAHATSSPSSKPFMVGYPRRLIDLSGGGYFESSFNVGRGRCLSLQSASAAAPTGPASGAGSLASLQIAEPYETARWWSDWSLQSTLPHWLGLEGSIHPDQVDQHSLFSAVCYGMPGGEHGDAAHCVSSTSSAHHVPMMAMILDQYSRSAERIALRLSLLPPPDGASSKRRVGVTALYGLCLPTHRCKVEVSIAYQYHTSAIIGASPETAGSSGQRDVPEQPWVVPVLIAWTDPSNSVCLPRQGIKSSQDTELITCIVDFELERYEMDSSPFPRGKRQVWLGVAAASSGTSEFPLAVSKLGVNVDTV